MSIFRRSKRTTGEPFVDSLVERHGHTPADVAAWDVGRVPFTKRQTVVVALPDRALVYCTGLDEHEMDIPYSTFHALSVGREDPSQMALEADRPPGVPDELMAGKPFLDHIAEKGLCLPPDRLLLLVFFETPPWDLAKELGNRVLPHLADPSVDAFDRIRKFMPLSEADA